MTAQADSLPEAEGREEPSDLLADASLEITGKDAAAVRDVSSALPVGTRVNITYLEHEEIGLRVQAAKVVNDVGFVAVPHIAARRLSTQRQLREQLARLSTANATSQIFVVGGDPATALGPYGDALSVIRSDLVGEFGVREVGIAGYPEGHPHISSVELWTALEAKTAEIARLGLRGSITTQFAFDADPVVRWVTEVRARDIALPIRIGVPGPAGVRRLLSYARRFGVGSSASIAHKYGLSLTRLAGTAGPDRLVRELEQRINPSEHGEVRLHFYPFGGLEATAQWLTHFRQRDFE